MWQGTLERGCRYLRQRAATPALRGNFTTYERRRDNHISGCASRGNL